MENNLIVITFLVLFFFTREGTCQKRYSDYTEFKTSFQVVGCLLDSSESDWLM